MHTDASNNRWLNDDDRQFYERELSSFVPPRVFDAHTHLWSQDLAQWDIESDCKSVGYTEYRCLMDDLHPGRDVAALFLPVFEDRSLIPAGNAWAAKGVAADRRCRGLFFITPEDDCDWVQQQVRSLGLHGLKCYHTMASSQPTWEAEIPEYLPDRLVRMADREGWVITLHVVKSRAMADPGNIHWVRHYCKTYPNMTLILAHSARGFQPSHNLEGLPQLADLPNLYFDSSTNCEPIAHEAILRIFGHKRLMYGSDLPVSHMRGRSIGTADSFLWLYKDSPVWMEKHRRVAPVLIGLEHLRSLKWACWSARLSDSQIEDIFWNNAARLLNVK